MLEYFMGEKYIFMYAISKEKQRVYRLAKEAATLEQIEGLIRGLKEKDFALYTENAFLLYLKLLDPVVGDFPEKKKLVLIPDGILSYIPFESLISHPVEPLSTYKNLAYLIKDFDISYHYSASLMAFNSRSKESAISQAPAESPFVGFAPEFKENNLPLLAKGTGQNQVLRESLQTLPQARKELKNIRIYLEEAIMQAMG